jgi:hypothetical protein
MFWLEKSVRGKMWWLTKVSEGINAGKKKSVRAYMLAASEKLCKGKYVLTEKVSKGNNVQSRRSDRGTILDSKKSARV